MDGYSVNIANGNAAPAAGPERVVIGNAELWHGDCRDVLPLVSKAAAIISDPPYGIGYVRGAGGNGFRPKAAQERGCHPIVGDDAPFDPAHLMAFENVLIWGANHYSARLPPGRWLVWDKLDGRESFGDSFSDADLAWHSRRKGGTRIFRHLWKGAVFSQKGETFNLRNGAQARSHPTQKPVALMAWCIKQAGTPSIVCDPYMGSGTTGEAAVLLGLKFCGVEIERRYFDISCERIEAAQRQGRMFDADGPAP